MDRVKQAMATIRRAEFLPVSLRVRAHEDVPLPIGYGQTNSQPSTVRQMLLWLDVQPGDRVLEVGSGSGWVAALLGYLVGPSGSVFAVERIRALIERGHRNCRKAGVKNVSFFAATDTLGLPNKGPFDRILVSAAARELPLVLIDQLDVGGKLVIPVGNAIFEITKQATDKLNIIRHGGFLFVPLIT